MNCQVGSPIRRSLGITAILAFPELIAEYHVLHRLLLPRHSPNALLALDLIQKKTDLLPSAILPQLGQTGPKAYFPAHAMSVAWTCPNSRSNGLVYLTWTTLSFQPGYRRRSEERDLNQPPSEEGPNRDLHPLVRSTVSLLYSLFTM